MSSGDREDLLSELRRLASDEGAPPTVHDLRRNSDYTIEDYQRQFASWEAALSTAGIQHQEDAETRSTGSDESGTVRFSDEELLEDLRFFATEIDGEPTSTEMRIRGSHSPSTYASRFGSWSNAIVAAGLTQNRSVGEIPEEDLITELQRLHEELGRIPALTDLEEHGHYHESTYYRRFDSWQAALREAGFDGIDQRYGSDIPDQDIIQDITRIAGVLGRPPTEAEYTAFGEYAVTTVKDRFGSIREALAEAESNEFNINYQQDNGRITDAELLSELHRVAKYLGKVPTAEDVREHGIYSFVTYQNRFGNLNTALRKAGMSRGHGSRRISDWELIIALRQLAVELGRVPPRVLMDDQGEHAGATFMNRFGSWSAALAYAGLERTQSGEDVLRLQCNLCGTVTEQALASIEFISGFCTPYCRTSWESMDVIRVPRDIPESVGTDENAFLERVTSYDGIPGKTSSCLTIASKLAETEFDSIATDDYIAVRNTGHISVWSQIDFDDPVIEVEQELIDLCRSPNP